MNNPKPTNGWTYSNSEYTRTAETRPNRGCNICGGTQQNDPEADFYCPHDDTHIELIEIDGNEAIVYKLGYEQARFAATEENITQWMENHPDLSERVPSS